MSSRGQRTWSGNIEQLSDLWDLEHYLTESRKRIDRTYDYRYSVLTDVFGRLIREGCLSEKELQGSRGRQAGVYPFLRQASGQTRGSWLETWRLMNDRSSARSTGTVIRRRSRNLTRLQYSPC